jgi:hypothetical protein
MFTDFFKALREGKEPTFTLEMAKRDIQILEAIRDGMQED